MTLTIATDHASLTAARALDTHDSLGYFAAENNAGIGELLEVSQVAIAAAREVADGASDDRLAADPVCVANAAAALAEREGSDAFATCDTDAMDVYRADARIILGALA